MPSFDILHYVTRVFRRPPLISRDNRIKSIPASSGSRCEPDNVLALQRHSNTNDYHNIHNILLIDSNLNIHQPIMTFLAFKIAKLLPTDCKQSKFPCNYFSYVFNFAITSWRRKYCTSLQTSLH